MELLGGISEALEAEDEGRILDLRHLTAWRRDGHVAQPLLHS